jgi:serine/threonine protein kinase/Flp pilus assembly protein TadD
MTLATGSRLGPYEILAPLGAGGMGEVYRARDPRLGRDVALKVLPDAVARDPERLARFEREARAVAGLSHPNILVLYSIEREGDLRFITMELVEGETLARHVVPGGMPIPLLLEISRTLAEALAAAHERGIVHRDLKPANVMIARDGRVKVLDFGLAKQALEGPEVEAGRSTTLAASLSAPGQVVGTAPYMAPEVLRGEAADARSDLFALGVTLYELACGRRPFGGKTPADVASAILRDAPPPLASRRADLPSDWMRVVERCLEKAPADRFQTALEFRDAVRRAAQHAAGHAAAGDTEGPSIAVLPFTNMSADPENEYFSDGLSEELLNVLAKIPDLKVTGRTSSFAFKGKHEDMREIGQKLGVGTLLEGSVRKAGNRVRITAQLVKVSDGFHLWSETYDRVLDDIFAVQDDIARSVSAALHVTLLGKAAAASRTAGESYQLVLRANHFFQQNSEAAMERAVSLYKRAIDHNPKDAAAWAGLARAYAFQSGYGYTEDDAGRKQAREAAERALALDPASWDAHEVKYLILCFLEFRWKEALEELRKARALAPGASVPIGSMAYYEAAFGRIDEALRLAKKAVELDPLNPSTHANQMRVESWAGNLEAALESNTRTLELSPSMTAQHSGRGMLYVRMGRAEEALAEIEKEVSQGYRTEALAVAYHALGRKRESDEAMAWLLAAHEQWSFQCAVAHAFRGENDEAFRLLDRAYEIRDPGFIGVQRDSMMAGLRDDPRWLPFLKKVGMEPVTPVD